MTSLLISTAFTSLLSVSTLPSADSDVQQTLMQSQLQMQQELTLSIRQQANQALSELFSELQSVQHRTATQNLLAVTNIAQPQAE